MKEEILSQILKELRQINSRLMPYEEKINILNMDCKTFLISNLCSDRVFNRLDQFGHLSVQDLFYKLKTDPDNDLFKGIGASSRHEISRIIKNVLN